MNQVWNNQRKDLVEKFVYKEYFIRLDAGDPWEGKTFGHGEFKKRLDYSFDSFPDMNFEITSLIEEQDHVAINWILTGTNSGPIQNFPPTHNKINANGMTIYHFTDNLISGHTQVFDRMTVMRQLGFA